MANTFTQLHIQVVFVVKYRSAFIEPHFEDALHKYMTGIIQNYGHKVLAINGMPDHVHVLMGFRPTQSLSDLMEILKGESSQWINAQKLLPTKFAWQKGYGGFSYTKSHVPRVTKYILNQKEHHQKMTFLDEFRSMLRNLEIDFDERYMFHEPL